MNTAPKTNIIAPAEKNTLNNGNSLFSAISFHHKHSTWYLSCLYFLFFAFTLLIYQNPADMGSIGFIISLNNVVA
jgi:hypothetical protein